MTHVMAGLGQGQASRLDTQPDAMLRFEAERRCLQETSGFALQAFTWLDEDHPRCQRQPPPLTLQVTRSHRAPSQQH